MKYFKSAAAFSLIVIASTANAHEGHSVASGFASGFMHPFLGWDHIAAMVAAGLWGAFLAKSSRLSGKTSIWTLPLIFLAGMLIGGIMGISAIPLPSVETGIATSLLVLGAMIALAVKLPAGLAGLMVASFGLFHGQAHGTELPAIANALTYCLGFMAATGLLHLIGISSGMLLRWPTGKIMLHTSGGIIALAGLGFLTGTV